MFLGFPGFRTGVTQLSFNFSGILQFCITLVNNAYKILTNTGHCFNSLLSIRESPLV